MDDERQPLLTPDVEVADQDSEAPCVPNPYASLPIFNTIHRVRHEVTASLDDPYSLEQLRAPRITASVVRPLMNRLWAIRDASLVYCLLVNKVQFLREQSFKGHQTIYTTRALLCELVALKVLRRFDEESPGTHGLLILSNAMVASFAPFQNAPPDVIRASGHASSWNFIHESGGYERKSTALEVAIISDSKLLISSPACQKVMDAIYVGRIVYTPTSFIDIIPDHYKQKPITIYRPDLAPVLNQYRLMVPRTRNILDITQFCILLTFYLLVMHYRDYERFTEHELFFCIYACGWVLDEFASILEHGWQCYTQNLWSFLDSIFSIMFFVYFVLRMHSLATGDIAGSAAPALDILSGAAPVLIPRLAFNLLSENILLVSLRTMMSDFMFLTVLAVWCFGGFLLSMTWLSGDNEDTVTIGKWMLFVWFGLDGTGIQRSVDFHRVIGPILMVTFAFLGNTLFLTILVSMLSNTFSKIASNATAEITYRRAVLTFEGVKSDAIFAYQPPFNIIAIFVMLPLKLIISPRWFHKVNVAAIRFLNAPLLFAIAAWERRRLWSDQDHAQRHGGKKMMGFSTWIYNLSKWWDFSAFSVHGDTQAVFDFDPPQSVLDDLADAGVTSPDAGRPPTANGEPKKQSSGNGKPTRQSSGTGKPTRQSSHNGRMTPAKRKESFGTASGLAEHINDFFHEHGGTEITGRLEQLEASSARMEAMLVKLSENFDDESTDDEEQVKMAKG